MTTKQGSVMTGLVIVSVVAFFYFVKVGRSKQVNDERQTPLILIPGTNSDKDRFDDLIQYAEKIGQRTS